ncbi:hypothetical protein, partial [Psychroserpens algicola]
MRTRKILADFPNGSVSFINLVLANATSHTQNRCTTFPKKMKTKPEIKNLELIWKLNYEWMILLVEGFK